ncbi:MAG TPA: hypothetical protein V6C90_13590 [Coleofasciculaceae cyanobacterium]
MPRQLLNSGFVLRFALHTPQLWKAIALRPFSQVLTRSISLPEHQVD